MNHNPYSALSRLCFKYGCSPSNTQRVLEIMAEELEKNKGGKNVKEN